MTKEQVTPKSKINLSVEVEISGSYITNATIHFYGGKMHSNDLMEREPIGKAIIQAINDKYLPQSLMEFTDSLSELTEDMLKYTKNFRNLLNGVDYGNHHWQGKMGVIHYITIHQEHRGKGLFIPFMWLILKTLKDELNVDTVLLQPDPVELKGVMQAELLPRKKD